MKRRTLLKVVTAVAAGAAALSVTVGAPPQDTVIKVGTVAGPDAQVRQVVQKDTKQKQGHYVKLSEFNDYEHPNAALDSGDL
ncbi:MetQ/NlpA family ABC transporter substrate-binding protein, partial [Burkholderia pseudomallei]